MNDGIKLAAIGCLSSLVVAPAFCQAPAANEGGPKSQYQQQPQEPRAHQSGLWHQYLEAGVKSEQAGNSQLAKRYYLGALSALEQKSASRKDTVKSKVDGKTYRIPFGSANVQELEKKLGGLYPEDWSKAPGTPAQQLSLREEQVNVLGRIARLNTAHSAHNSDFAARSQQRYEKAAAELEQAKEQKSGSGGK